MSETHPSIAHNIVEKQRSSDVCLKELSAFNNMILGESVRKGLQKCGFVLPTNIQATAIPVGKAGLDLLVQSKSGTGKTLIFCTIICEAYRAVIPEPQSLIVVPTREIAVQIESVLNGIGQYCKHFRCVSVIGGMDAADDRKRLQGAKSIVGTPGRILHLINNGVLNTSEIGVVILDEADRLYTSSFRSDVERILKALPHKRQSIACSATFCNDLDKQLAKRMLNPLFISTEERATALVGIRQFAYVLPEQKTSILEMESKLDAIRDVFGRISFKQCLIFAGSQSRADSYRNYLERDGWPCELISGAQDQKTRLDIFGRFRDFKIRILVATDLMARGVDSEHVNLVINMEVPTEMVTYLHRIGRAGRFGSPGIAISFLSSEKEHATFRRICSDVGGGMTVFQFPQHSVGETELHFWDFSKLFDLYNGATGTTTTQPQNDENKENVAARQTTEDCSASSSIDTKTFQVNSKDSVFNLMELPPPAGDSLAVVAGREAKLTAVTADSHLSSSQQLPSSNTIDDASSIAADSIRSSSHRDMSAAEDPKLTAQIPQLYKLLVDGHSAEQQRSNTAMETDLFDDYEKATAKTGDDDSSCCTTKTDDPQMTMKKLHNFKALLYDNSAAHESGSSKQVDIYSDYENFNCTANSKDATCISHAAECSEDNSKATFVMSVDTPTNVQDSIEELQDDSSYNKEAFPASEVASVSEIRHFPSLQQPLHVLGKQRNLSVNRAATIDILPAAVAAVAAADNQESSSFEDEPLNDTDDEAALHHSADDDENEEASSGFNENTTSASSGIDTSDDEVVALAYRQDDADSEDSFRSDESIPSDDGVEDDGDESDTSTDVGDESSDCSDAEDGSAEIAHNPAVMESWIRLFNTQMQLIQDYVRITKSLRI